MSSGESSLPDYEPAVVIDNGSGVCKIGIAGEDEPTQTFPSIIGTVREEGEEIDGRTSFVGDEAEEYRDLLTIQYPIEHGIVTDWDAMEKIWEHCFELLSENNEDFSPDAQPVLLTEAPRNPRKNRERMVEFMFDTFDVPAVYVALQAILALYSSGRTTGTVLDAGDGVTHCVPVVDGYTMPNAIKRQELAGRDLTNYMADILNAGDLDQEAASLTTTAELECVREMKEQFCYVTMDYEAAMALAEETKEFSRDPDTYTLPDGREISLGAVRFRVPEALFNPSLLGREAATCPGYPALVNNVINDCPIDSRASLMSNIVLSGGTTMFPGLEKRLTKELQKLTKMQVKVHAPSERKYSVWIGGAISAAMDSQQWMTQADYEEEGAAYIHRITHDGLT